jgi:predicted Fe-Mo cluster-binding NifX family protein
MRVAIPVNGEEISHRVGERVQMLVISVESGVTHRLKLELVRAILPETFARTLAGELIETLVCEDLDGPRRAALEKRGIRVITNVTGGVSDAVAAVNRDIEECQARAARDVGLPRFTKWTQPAGLTAPAPAAAH